MPTDPAKDPTPAESPTESPAETPAERRAEAARPVLPTVSSDETGEGWGDWREGADDDERFLREVPPHHGTY
jgi:hypothetical protein